MAPQQLPVTPALESIADPGSSAESGGARPRLERGWRVAVVLKRVTPLPLKTQGFGLPPVSPTLVRPEGRDNLRYGSGRGVSVHPGLVQRRNPFQKGPERARIFKPGLSAAPVGVGRLERCSVTLRLALQRWRRVPPLVPLFEREVVPVWARRRARPGEHWLVCGVTGA